MTSILVAICRISGNNFKRHYVKKEKLFVDFLLHFWNVHERQNIFFKKMSVVDSLLPKLLNPKEAIT